LFTKILKEKPNKEINFNLKRNIKKRNIEKRIIEKKGKKKEI
jgi:hypothetical protein